MIGSSVDVELADMAKEFGVSTRKLMAGVMNDAYDQIGSDDLVHGDKGDPLFFRVDRGRAYALFGDDLDRVEQDMSTVENMSTSRGGEAAPTVRGNEGSRAPTATSVSAASKTANAPVGRSRPEVREPSTTDSDVTTTTGKDARKNGASPAKTDRGPQGGAVQTGQKETGVQKRENAPAKTGQETSTVAEVGKTALAVAGVYAGATALISLLSGGQGQNQQARGLSGRQKQDIFDQGYYGYYQGVEYNPYDPNTEAGRLYQEGWRQAQEEMGTPALN
jgi:hypothetical protein